MSLLERYKKTLITGTRGDQGVIEFDANGAYLGNNPGPIPPKVSPLEKEYEKGNADQELDGTPKNGGSDNDPSSGFVQRYTQDNAYYTTQEGLVRSNISTNDLIQSTAITGLDVEDNAAGVDQGGTGGPINDPNYSGFIQNYTPQNPYYTTQEGIVRATEGESSLTDTLKITALDVENPESGVKQGSGGGPNRTSAANGEKSTFLDGGNYKVLRYPTRAQEINSEYNVEDAGTLETMTLQQYTPNRTYLEVLADPSLEIEEVIKSTPPPTGEEPGGGVPSSIDDSIVPPDVAPSLNDLNFNI